MKSKYYLIAALLALSFTHNYLMADGSAAINLSPLAGSYKVGQTFNVVISVNPGSEKIDTVRAKLTFPPDLLEIKSFSTSPVFSYQAGSNGFDNTAGTFSWGAGTPGGITTTSNFGTVTFNVKKTGNAQISVSKDSMTLSAGENKFNGQESLSTYSLLAAAAGSSNPPVKSATQPVAKTNIQNPAPAAEQPVSNNNAVDTQILTKKQSQNSASSLAGSLPFGIEIRVWIVLAIILVLMLMGFTIYKIITPILNSKVKK